MVRFVRASLHFRTEHTGREVKRFKVIFMRITLWLNRCVVLNSTDSIYIFVLLLTFWPVQPNK